jgi:signal transduction histidine kinase
MSSVTHELRTPLTSIRALSEMMLDDPDIDVADRQRFLGIIVSETVRLTRLVNQVLDMAKIESGHAEWHNTDIDLCELVRHSATPPCSSSATAAPSCTCTCPSRCRRCAPTTTACCR